MIPLEKHKGECASVYSGLYKRWEDFNTPIYKANKEGIRSVSEFQQAINNLRYAEKLDPKIPEFVYRGEGKTYKTYLQPVIIRRCHNLSPLKKGNHITSKEVNEIYRFQRSNTGKSFAKYISEEAVDWAHLTQHYWEEGDYLTRLLDVTKNELVALYFACYNKKYFDQDGWVFIFPRDSYRPQTKPLDSITWKDIEQGIPNSYFELYEDNEKQELPHNVPVLYEPIASPKLVDVDKRLKAQLGAFIWWHPLVELNKQSYFCVLICGEAKKQIKKELFQQFNIYNGSLFPRNSALINHLEKTICWIRYHLN